MEHMKHNVNKCKDKLQACNKQHEQIPLDGGNCFFSKSDIPTVERRTTQLTNKISN